MIWKDYLIITETILLLSPLLDILIVNYKMRKK
jgi:hypothetical protein